ncbi:MAG: metal ABC transporter permease [Candidatus Hydrogenedentes bacterium]|nr:metal ABC transporter permease [Candidatus Hydrogenedentota bacterium]
MIELIEALLDPQAPFLRYAFLAGILSSVAFGVIGAYVVARRITYIAGAIAHSVLGGIGLAIFLQYRLGWTWCEPLHGATAAALLSAVIIGLAGLYAGEREDTIIGAVWAVGMGAGLLFLQWTPGNYDPMSYLFGNILLITKRDLVLILLLDTAVIALAALFHNKLVAVCFDSEFARLRGVRVEAYYLLLLCLTALTVVLLISVVGIVLVIALLTLPAATAGQFARRISSMMLIAVTCCAGVVGGGLGISYSFEILSGPAIILLSGGVYLLVVAGTALARRLRLGKGKPASAIRARDAEQQEHIQGGA